MKYVVCRRRAIEARRLPVAELDPLRQSVSRTSPSESGRLLSLSKAKLSEVLSEINLCEVNLSENGRRWPVSKRAGTCLRRRPLSGVVRM